ncbi:MAG: hypothetical protein PHF20_08815, partial [Halothiobacillaceae bacterium]|nr:hypothetical protein [Halothiobacillaceae bacterium]
RKSKISENVRPPPRLWSNELFELLQFLDCCCGSNMALLAAWLLPAHDAVVNDLALKPSCRASTGSARTVYHE